MGKDGGRISSHQIAGILEVVCCVHGMTLGKTETPTRIPRDRTCPDQHSGGACSPSVFKVSQLGHYRSCKENLALFSVCIDAPLHHFLVTQKM